MTVAMAVVLASHASSLAGAPAVVVLAGPLQVLLGVTGIGWPTPDSTSRGRRGDRDLTDGTGGEPRFPPP